MYYIDQRVQKRFDALSKEVKEEIMKQDVKLYTYSDLLRCISSLAPKS